MPTIRRDPALLDGWGGRVLNAAAIGREIGVCRQTAGAFVTARVVHALPLPAFLEDLETWILRWRTPQDSRQALRRINERLFQG